jgi:phage gpG-like protein
VPVEGVDAAVAALEALGLRMRAATVAAVDEGADLLADEVRAALGRSEYPPSSQPGTPPARRSGDLQESIEQLTEETDAGARAEVWPSTVYARIQELGGITGRDYRTHLQPRPYVEPSVDEVAWPFGDCLYRAWSNAVGG